MRSKDEILKVLDNTLSKSTSIDDKILTTSILTLEALVDIRDILKDFSRLIAVRTGSTDIS